MPKVDHPRRAKTQHRSMSQKYEDYDNMVHSTWAKGETSARRATVSVPGKQSVAARMLGRAKTAAGASISKSVKAARGLFTGGAVDPADHHAAKKRKANTKQGEMKGLFDLITGVRNASLVAGFAKTIAKKK